MILIMEVDTGKIQNAGHRFAVETLEGIAANIKALQSNGMTQERGVIHTTGNDGKMVAVGTWRFDARREV